jgi:hypothetical protein
MRKRGMAVEPRAGPTDSRQLRRWQARGAGRATARAGRADCTQVRDAPAASAARRGSAAGARGPYGLGAPDTTRTSSRGAYHTGVGTVAARRSRYGSNGSGVPVPPAAERRAFSCAAGSRGKRTGRRHGEAASKRRAADPGRTPRASTRSKTPWTA